MAAPVPNTDANTGTVFQRCHPQLASGLFRFDVGIDTQRHHGSGKVLSTGYRKLDRELDLASEAARRGRVFGFAGVGEMHDDALALIHDIAGTWLLDDTTGTNPQPQPQPQPLQQPQLQSDKKPHPRLFLIEPPTPTSTTSSLVDIYTHLSAHLSSTNSTNSINPTHPRILDDLTSQISLLRPLSLLGILQSLTEISSSLDQQPHAENKGSSDDVLVIVRNLGASILASQAENSGGIGSKTAALVKAVTKGIRGLVRKGRVVGVHVDVLVECGVLSTSGVSASTGRGGDSFNVGGEDGRAIGGSDVGVRLRSAFSSPLGRKLRFVLETAAGEVAGTEEQQNREPSEFEAARSGAGVGTGRIMRERMPLVRMVEDMLDLLVLVHDGFGIVSDTEERNKAAGTKTCIVEVVKDEVGGSLGRWSIWDRGAKERR